MEKGDRCFDNHHFIYIR